MAVVARYRLVLIILLMMHQAEDCICFMIKLVSIQFGGLPSGWIVTLVAIRIKHTIMAGWLRVAIHTQFGDSTEQTDWRSVLSRDRPGRVSVLMALGAVYLNVLSHQWKVCCGMIKVRQAVQTIMTGETVNPELLIMLEHKSAFLICMTGIATL